MKELWEVGLWVTVFLCIQGAEERSSKGVEGWIRSWCDTSKHKAKVLDPTDWFEKGHDFVGETTNLDGMWVSVYKNGVYIWAPPPAAVGAAMEQLRKAR